jgi:uncharacterized protein (DUF433 family)
MSTVTYPHIEIDAESIPWLAGTRTKVVEVVLDRLAHHWDADEMHRQHPHLSLAQIYAALTYYYDHQQEIDEDIERRSHDVQEIKAKLGGSSLRLKLQQMRRRS